LAARLATRRATPVDLDALRAVLDDHVRVVDSGDEVANVELDTRFHAIIRDAAGNADLSAILGRIQARAHLSRYSLWRGGRNPHAAVAEHRAVFAAIVARDADAAERAARRHITNLMDRIDGVSPAPADPRVPEAVPQGAR
jgi:DNA-binding GntR family transcriptional regulator